jgi:hypothetical protein
MCSSYDYLSSNDEWDLEKIGYCYASSFARKQEAPHFLFHLNLPDCFRMRLVPIFWILRICLVVVGLPGLATPAHLGRV